MNRDDIIRMAREAGFEVDGNSWVHSPNAILVDGRKSIDKQLTRFASLIAAAEREAIAQMFDDPPPLASDDQNKRGGCLICGFTPAVAAKVIRARSNP